MHASKMHAGDRSCKKVSQVPGLVPFTHRIQHADRQHVRNAQSSGDPIGCVCTQWDQGMMLVSSMQRMNGRGLTNNIAELLVQRKRAET